MAWSYLQIQPVLAWWEPVAGVLRRSCVIVLPGLCGSFLKLHYSPFGSSSAATSFPRNAPAPLLFLKAASSPFPLAAAGASSLQLQQVKTPDFCEGQRNLWEADGKKGDAGWVGGENLDKLIGLWPLIDKLGEYVRCYIISSSGNEQG